MALVYYRNGVRIHKMRLRILVYAERVIVCNHMKYESGGYR